jgi:hypothetical protein
MQRATKPQLVFPVTLLLLSALSQRPISAQTPSVIFKGNNTHSGTETFTNINHVVFWDGSKYPLTAAGLQSAISAACNGTIPGRVEFPLTGVGQFVTISATVTVPSNCSLNGPGKDRIILHSSVSLNAAIMTVANASKVVLSGFGLDGNRANNSNVNDCFDLGPSTSDILIDQLRISNCLSQGVLIFSGSAHVTIQNSEFFNIGSFPSSPFTAAIDIFSNTSPGVSDIRIGPDNSIHDSSFGIVLSTQNNNISSVNIFDNQIYSNANDAIEILGQNSPGVISGFRAQNNEMFCNGWPANGTGFNSNCTAGFLQSGAVASGGGVGVDLIQNADQRVIHPIVSGNYIHDNLFEGLALTTNIQGRVNTSGTAVNWVSGAQFNVNWKNGETLYINNAFYKIASVASSTSLTLQTSAGTQTETGISSRSFMWASVTGNQSINNGGTAGSGPVGPGIYCQFADGNTFGQNVMKNNFLEGLELFGCDFNTSSGDRAYSNNTSNTAERNNGFAVIGGLADAFFGDTTDDPVAAPKQTVGLLIDANSTSTTVNSSSLYGTVAQVTDNGFGSSQQFISGSPNPTNGNTVALYNQGSIGPTISGLAFQVRTGTIPATAALFDSGRNLILNKGLRIADQGTCTMAAGTCSTQTLSHTYSAAPVCTGNWNGSGGALTGFLKFPSTTTTVTPASTVGTDTPQINWICFGN